MLSFGEKIAKLGPADHEIIVLRAIIKKIKEKKKEINASKIYSPVSYTHLTLPTILRV